VNQESTVVSERVDQNECIDRKERVSLEERTDATERVVSYESSTAPERLRCPLCESFEFLAPDEPYARAIAREIKLC